MRSAAVVLLFVALLAVVASADKHNNGNKKGHKDEDYYKCHARAYAKASAKANSYKWSGARADAYAEAEAVSHCKGRRGYSDSIAEAVSKAYASGDYGSQAYAKSKAYASGNNAVASASATAVAGGKRKLLNGHDDHSWFDDDYFTCHSRAYASATAKARTYGWDNSRASAYAEAEAVSSCKGRRGYSDAFAKAVSNARAFGDDAVAAANSKAVAFGDDASAHAKSNAVASGDNAFASAKAVAVANGKRKLLNGNRKFLPDNVVAAAA